MESDNEEIISDFPWWTFLHLPNYRAGNVDMARARLSVVSKKLISDIDKIHTIPGVINESC